MRSRSDNAMGPKGGSITRVVLRSADFTPLEYACIHMYSVWGAGKVRIRVFEYLSACIHHLGSWATFDHSQCCRQHGALALARAQSSDRRRDSGAGQRTALERHARKKKT